MVSSPSPSSKLSSSSTEIQNWTFTFSAVNSRSQTLENPIGYKPLSDKALLADEPVQVSAQSRAGRSQDMSHREDRQSGQRLIGSIREKAWQLTWSPIKSLGMNLVMMYFGGGDPGIFTVLIISYALLNACKTLLSVNHVFQNLEDALAGVTDVRNSSSSISVTTRTSASTTANKKHQRDDETAADVAVMRKEERHPLVKFFRSPFLLQKMAFVLISMSITTYILYHAATMGIIPWRTGDFLGLIPEHKEIEQAFAAF